jgi:predicted  nucleic acid-binding Zn-ribbon protein
MASSQWSELESYRQLLHEYEQRTADYEKRLKVFRQAQATGGLDQQQLARMQHELDSEQPHLEALFKQLEGIRKDLARARDAALAP